MPARRPVSLALGITFEDELVDGDDARRWQALVRAASAVLWQASEGQVFVGRCTLADRASWGHVRVPHGALDLEVLASGAAFELSAPGGEHWRITSPGLPADDERTAQLFAAEIARGVYGLDEHERCAGRGDAPAGPGCLLAGTALRLCRDADTPRVVRRSCQSVIDQRWLGHATFPSPGWNADEPAPRTEFERLRETP